MIILKAKFIGMSSLGFKRGENYELSIRVVPKIRSLDGKTLESEIDIQSHDNRCKYSTVDKFLQNWMVLTIDSIGIGSGSSGVSGSIGSIGFGGAPGTTGTSGTYAGLIGPNGLIGISGSSGYSGISTGTTTYTTTFAFASNTNDSHWEEAISTLRKSLRNNKLETLLSQ